MFPFKCDIAMAQHQLLENGATLSAMVKVVHPLVSFKPHTHILGIYMHLGKL